MEETSALKSNLTKLNWHSFCFGVAPYIPIIFLFFRAAGLSFTEIGFISAAQWFSQLVLEVPTGVFADKYGRKTSMAIAASLASISYLLFFLGSSFIVFFIANLIFGAANCFLSGSDTSFIHDSLGAEGKEGQFGKQLGRYYTYFFAGAAISSIAASFLPVGQYRLSFAITIPFALLSFLAVISTSEPKQKEQSGKKEFWKHLSGAFQRITSQPEIIAVLIYYVVITLAIQVFFRYMQFFLQDSGIDTKYNGLLYAAFISIAAGMSYVAHGIEKVFKKNGSLIALVSAVIISFLLLSQSHAIAVVVTAFVLIELSYGFLRPVLNGYFHKLVESHNRATVDSMKAFSVDTSLVILLPLFGYLSDKVGISKMIFCLALLTFAVVIIPLIKLLKLSYQTES